MIGSKRLLATFETTNFRFFDFSSFNKVIFDPFYWSDLKKLFLLDAFFESFFNDLFPKSQSMSNQFCSIETDRRIMIIRLIFYTKMFVLFNILLILIFNYSIDFINFDFQLINNYVILKIKLTESTISCYKCANSSALAEHDWRIFNITIDPYAYKPCAPKFDHSILEVVQCNFCASIVDKCKFSHLITIDFN